jgi:integrase
MKTWSADELRRFVNGVHTDRLFALWLTIASTGLRRGEALGLKWSDIDLDAARISVQRSLVSVGYKPMLSEPKTARGRRSIALDRTTVSALIAHRRAQIEERLAWGPAYEDGDFVFCRENGSPIHPERLTKSFEAHVRKIGLPRIRLHDLRHTHATLALAAGIHPKVVSERLGHSSIAITLDTYSHAIPALQEEAAERIASLLADGSA